MITVDEIMTVDPYTLPETATLGDAIRLMRQKNIRHIPIVDAEGGLVGLITHRDALSAAESTLRDEAERKNVETVRLADIMISDVATVDEHSNLRRAALFLEKHKYGCLPVVTQGKLRGIVTGRDFVAVAINLLEQLETSGPVDEN